MKKIKILGIFAVFFLISLSGLYFYIKKEYSPEKIKRITLSFLKKEFPKGNFELKSLKTSFGLGLKIEINEFGIKKGKEKALFSVQKVKCSLPLLSLFKKDKSIKMDFFGPKIFFKARKDGNNFSDVFLSQKKISKSKTDKGGSSNYYLPFVKNLNVDINLYKIDVTSISEKGEKGNFQFENLSIEDIGFSKDVKIKFESKILLKGTKKFFNVEGKGKIETKDFIESKELEGELKVYVYNIKFDKLKIPPLKNKIKFKLKKEGDLSGRFLSEAKDDKIKFDYVVDKKGISVNKLQVGLNLKPYLNEFSKPVVFENSDFNVSGNLKIINKNIYPFFKTNLNSSLVINDKKVNLNSVSQINSKKLTIDTKIKMFSGEIENIINTDFKINEFLIKKKIPLINMAVNVRDIVIPKDFIKENLKGEDSNKKDKSVKKNNFLSLIPPGKIKLSIKKSKIAGTHLSADGKIVCKKNNMAIKFLNFKYGKGMGKLTLLAKAVKKSIKTKLSLEAKKINLKNFDAFIPSSFGKIEGEYSLNTKGHADIFKNNRLNYNVLFDLKGENTKVEKFKVSEYLKEYLNKVSILKVWSKNRPINFTSGLDKVYFKGSVSNKKFNFKNIKIVGRKGDFEIKGNGHMFPNNNLKQGVIYLDFIERKIGLSQFLKKSVGVNKLLVKLRTKKLTVSPDYSYTIKKISTGLYNNKGKKIIRKAISKKIKPALKKNIDKKLKKVLKDKKIKNFLKLF